MGHIKPPGVFTDDGVPNKNSELWEWDEWKGNVSWLLFQYILEPNLVNMILNFWSQDIDVVREFHESLRVNTSNPAENWGKMGAQGVPMNFHLPFDHTMWRNWISLVDNINYTMHGFIQGDDGEEGWIEVDELADKIDVINHIQLNWLRGGLIIHPANVQNLESLTGCRYIYNEFRNIMDKYEPGIDTADISDEDYIAIRFLVYDDLPYEADDFYAGEGPPYVYIAEGCDE
jgi:hypothetical protein